MNILVTGGLGYIGSNVVRKILREGLAKKVLIVDNLSNSTEEVFRLLNEESGKTKLSLLKINYELLNTYILNEFDIDTIMHFAGSLIVEESVKDPLLYYKNNTGSTIELLINTKNTSVKNFIFSSTAAVYKEKDDPVTEKDLTEPVSPYGESKLMIEKVLRDFAAASELNYIALRYFNVAGCSNDMKYGQRGENATHLIKLAVEAAIGKRESITIYGTDYDTEDGSCIRDFIHVEDLADAHILALKNITDKQEIYNIGNGFGYSVKEVLNEIKRMRELTIIEGNRRPGDIKK